MVGNWTDWKVTRWDGEAYVCERVRAYRSWFFGFIREERERKRFPGLGETASLAAANGERLVPEKEHYAHVNEMIAHHKQRAGEFKAENDLLRANNAGLKQRADAFENAYALEKQAYEELLAAVKAGEATKPEPKKARRARRA